MTTIVGFVNLLAIFYNLQRHPDRYNRAIAGGMMISGWIITQMILIQTIHWLHFIYLGVGMLIILIAYQLKGKWAVEHLGGFNHQLLNCLILLNLFK